MLLTVALLFALLAASVSALESDTRTSALERLRRELVACASVIDLSADALTPAEVGRIYAGLLEDDPSLFHVAPRLSYSTGKNTVVAVYPAYTLTGTDLAVARAFYRSTLSELLSEVERVAETHPLSDAETALYIHDLLAARYDYDVRTLTADGTAAGNRDAYSLFREGTGVCQAYALAALALLRAAGLEADFVSSPSMDHAWVHVRVDGTWYHMDVTRDDPVAIRSDGSAVPAGTVTHRRVLRSDAGMRSLGYHDFSCAGGHTCTDGRYETPAVMTALSALVTPLHPVLTGNRTPPIWVGETATGGLLPIRVSGEGITVYAEGDLDGDGAVTPGDLLLVSDASLPARWRAWMRQRVLVAASAERTEISPDPSTASLSPTSTRRE